jgi:hypothetical protein
MDAPNRLGVSASMKNDVTFPALNLDRCMDMRLRSWAFDFPEFAAWRCVPVCDPPVASKDDWLTFAAGGVNAKD